jgi:hypothetical protein
VVAGRREAADAEELSLRCVSEAVEHRQLVFEAGAGDSDGEELVVEFSLAFDEAL